MRAGIDGQPGDVPALHRDVREAVRFDPASFNGYMGNEAVSPGTDPVENGEGWLDRLRSRLAKVDSIGDTLDAYTAAMRGALAGQAGALVERYGDALPTLERERDRLADQVAKTGDGLIGKRAELAKLNGDSESAPVTA